MIAVSDIRTQNIKITRRPIVYYWWFKSSCFEQLFRLLNEEIKYKKIKKEQFNNEKYGLLYVGRAQSGHDRLVKYHILDSSNFHRIKTVENGRVSSLRQTLCGLLQLPMSTSKEAVNDFMDENCLVDFKICNFEGLNDMEELTIKANYLPLNYQKTKGILSEEHRRILSNCKKSVRR